MKKIIGFFIVTLLIGATVLPVAGINDEIGNECTVSSMIDTTPPVTTKTIYYAYGPNDEWVSGGSVFILTAADDESGVAATYYRIWYNGLWTPWMIYTMGFYLGMAEGIYYLEFYSIDNANNVEDVNSQIHYLDWSAPTTTLEFGSPYWTDGVDEWITSNTPIHLEGTDPPVSITPPVDGSGVKCITYRYGGYGTDWTIAYGDETTFSIPDGCSHTIEYYSVDNLNQVLPYNSQFVTVDDTKADAGGPLLVNPYEMVQFDSSGSHISSCMLPVTYLWDFGDGDTSTEQNPTHTYQVEGISTFTVTLKITTQHFSHFDTTTVIIDSEPYKPSNPNPENHANYVDVDADLNWTGGDPDEGDKIIYDIYFGDVSPPPLVKSGHNDTYYNLSTMNFSTTYYWFIISKDIYGKTNGGVLWDFTTVGEDMNQPPNKPATPSGKTNGKAGTTYTYSTSTTDPNDDPIEYQFDWGDGSVSTWSSSESASHSWSEGTYLVKVKARDSYSLESEWSDPLSISMPKNKIINLFSWFHWFLEQYPRLFPILLGQILDV